jgi:tRNA (cmo5U34)-methyltransferase
VAVPARAEQLATLLALLPFSPDTPFHLVEIGCGEGILSAALLACFPQTTVTALDGSAQMCAVTRQRLQQFGNRAHVSLFDLASAAWYPHLHHADAVLSSLCLHHLADAAKRALYAEIHRRTSPRAALLVADLVAPAHPLVNALFAATWDRAAAAQSLAHTGSLEGFARFQQAEWNHYRYPDPVDQPSPLFDQLQWLKAAGFAVVDCFWMQAGHAIFGGFKTKAAPDGERLAFETILAAVEHQLNS